MELRGNLLPITLEEANRLFHNYYDRANPLNDRFKGFYIDRDQLNVMNTLAADPTLAGFRVYLGLTDAGETVSIVVGVSTGQADVTTIAGKIYKTVTRFHHPCPPSCDVNSQITR